MFLLGMDNCIDVPRGGVRSLLTWTISVECLLRARLCCHHWSWGLTGKSKALPLCLYASPHGEEINNTAGKLVTVPSKLLRTERKEKG